jgi:predicted nucleotide-binding protein
MYYHVIIKDEGKYGKTRYTVVYNAPKEDLRILDASLRQTETFIFCGKYFNPSRIDGVTVFFSEQMFEKLVFPDGRPSIEHTGWEIFILFQKNRVQGVAACTATYIGIGPQGKGESTEISKIPGERKKVFIGHGRDLKEALELQKYLKEDLQVPAEMFEDMKKRSGCRTVADILDYFRKNVGYAFIIFTPDDYGCLCEEMDTLANKLCRDRKKSRTEAVDEILGALKKRARQNVVFELGLFIGAMEGERVCYLLQKDVSDTPSNMDGVLHEPFEKSISETFVPIAEKLREIGLVKA